MRSPRTASGYASSSSSTAARPPSRPRRPPAAVTQPAHRSDASPARPGDRSRESRTAPRMASTPSSVHVRATIVSHSYARGMPDELAQQRRADAAATGSGEHANLTANRSPKSERLGETGPTTSPSSSATYSRRSGSTAGPRELDRARRTRSEAASARMWIEGLEVRVAYRCADLDAHPDRFSFRAASRSARRGGRPRARAGSRRPDDDQRPDVRPHRRQTPAPSMIASRIPSSAYVAGEIDREPLHPLGQDLDRVVDAGDDEQQPLGDEAELRALLGRDQRQDGGHHPDPDERDRGDEQHEQGGREVGVRQDRGRRRARRRRRAAPPE